MKKTKVICSVGPSCNDAKTLSEMAIHGMSVARINFSHGDYEEKDKIIWGMKTKFQGAQRRIDSIKSVTKINDRIERN